MASGMIEEEDVKEEVEGEDIPVDYEGGVIATAPLRRTTSTLLCLRSPLQLLQR